jgi:glucose dehydrogenase
MNIPQTNKKIDLLWETSAKNYNSHRFFNSDLINKNNISQLTKFWTFNSGKFDPIQTIQAPPIFINNQLIYNH